MRNWISICLVLGVAVAGTVPVASANPKKGASEAKVFFVEPKDGATVGTEFQVKFGVEGMKIKPAGEAVRGTGHHHLIIDGGSVPEGKVIPTDETHLHFGKGQTETKLKLAPGKHKLTLQFANGAHVSYGEKMSAAISVNVK